MTNVHRLNQDNVLGGEDDELSPNAFDHREGAMEIEDEQPVAQKKKSTLMPLIVGAVAALGIIGFFGWKIASPYFAQNGANDEAFTPITAAPKPFEAQPGDGVATGAVTGNDPTFNLPALPEAQNAASGVAAQGQIAPPGLAGQSPAAAPQVAVQPLPTPKLAVSQPPAPAPAQAGPSTEDIAQIHKRIDGIVVALDSLKEAVAKLQQQAQAKPAPVKASVVAKPKQVVAAKKPSPAPVVTALSPAQTAVKLEKLDAAKPQGATAPAPALQLQAVLQDRAWFKTSTGETITVSPGEELKGVGIVQQIDAETGRVVFVNGTVFQ